MACAMSDWLRRQAEARRTAAAFEAAQAERIRLIGQRRRELLTANVVLACGALLLAAGAGTASFTAAGLGVLLYTVIQSPGYFIARRELGAVVMFAVLVALTIGALVILLAA
jgi:hypothetical protein